LDRSVGRVGLNSVGRVNDHLTPRRLWLVGTALSLLAIHSNWDVPLAAWLFPIFLLRYLHLTPPRHGTLRVFYALLIGTILWLVLTSLAFVPTTLMLFTALAAAKTLAFAVDRLAAQRLRNGLLSTLVFPVCVVAVEVLFVELADFGSFGVLGATQHAFLPLVQISSVTGVYGVSFLVAWSASTVNWAWGHGFRGVRTPVLTHLAVLAAVLGAGATQLLVFPPTTDTVRVAALDVSADAREAAERTAERLQVRYWKAEQVVAAEPAAVRAAFAPMVEELVERTEAEAAAGARIVVWPETQARVLDRDLPALLARVGEIARRHQTYVNTAFALYTDQAPFVRNISSMVIPDGQVAWSYDKTHPTPMEPMRPGTDPVPVRDTPYGRLASVICYDADFPDLVRLPVDVLLVPSADWSGFEYLHAQKAVFRAVENGYSVVRAASHGVSTVIDGQGRVLAQNDSFTTRAPVLVAAVPVQPRITTVYHRIGDVFGWLCVVAAAAFSLRFLPRGRGPRPAPGSAAPAGSVSR
jgi:apolipoprotein N-acyltransferase